MKSFFNDDGGFSAKDFIMVLFGAVYLAMIRFCFYLSFSTEIKEETITLITLMEPAVMTDIGGVFAVSTVSAFRVNKIKDTEVAGKDNDKPLI